MKRLLLIACLGSISLSPLVARADQVAVKKPAKLVTVAKDKLVLAKGIFFKPSSSTIHEDSLPTLDAVAGVLEKNAKMRLRIEVHTDSRGSSAYNRKVSQDRANAIKKYLVGKGIQAKRLVAKGYGEDQPIADNQTEAGRAANRRIALVVLAK